MVPQIGCARPRLPLRGQLWFALWLGCAARSLVSSRLGKAAEVVNAHLAPQAGILLLLF